MKSFSDTEQFQRGLPPTNHPTINTRSLCCTSDGMGILTISWTYTQGINIATQFAVYVRYGGGTVSINDLHFDVNATTSAAQFSLPMQLSIGVRYTVGVAAFAVCRSDAIFNSTMTEAHGEVLDQYQTEITIKPEFASCFISHSSKDQEFAERLYADLQAKGVRCWFAPEDLKIGDKFRIRIDESIQIHDKLLLVLSEDSIASAWVEKEVETAFENERDRNSIVLFPIRLDDSVMDGKLGWAADIKRSRYIGDFTKWKDHDSYQEAFDRLLRDLKAEKAF
jgi:hypothetical protein